MNTAMTNLTRLATMMLVGAVAFPTAAEDWPQWGRTETNNMSSPNQKGLPTDFYPGDFVGATDEIDKATMKNIKWVAKLGSQSYGNPTVSQGKVFVGTNNDTPRDPRFQGDRSTVYCLDEQTGEFIWQLNVPKMGTGKVSDWEFLGICSSPTVDGDRIYLVTNLCEVICLDIDGMADGNDGPFKDEGKYMGGKGEPMEVKSTDADIIWVLNMIDECGVFPHNITSSSVCVAGDKLWVSTSNGVDYGHVETPAPRAPSLILVDKRTGKLLGMEASGLSERIYHCNWSSPARLKTDTLDLCIFGGPDGWAYAFSPEPTTDEFGDPILKEVWRFDCNLPEYRTHRGRPARYASRGGPSEVIASPVVYDGKVYVPIGQDPEHGEGVGNLVCIDPTKTGDVTQSAKVWNYDKINRSLSTPSIVDDMLFVADFSGFVYCLDAKTGELYWRHDTKGHIRGSACVADGKLYIGNEDGYLTILKAGKELELLGEIDMMAPVYSSPIVANGVLYVASHTHLFAIKEQAPKEPAP
jgi:outer membrane protein assembly factor BamB